jgi:hypothetical protein
MSLPRNKSQKSQLLLLLSLSIQSRRRLTTHASRRPPQPLHHWPVLQRSAALPPGNSRAPHECGTRGSTPACCLQPCSMSPSPPPRHHAVCRPTTSLYHQAQMDCFPQHTAFLSRGGRRLPCSDPHVALSPDGQPHLLVSEKFDTHMNIKVTTLCLHVNHIPCCYGIS